MLRLAVPVITARRGLSPPRCTTCLAPQEGARLLCQAPVLFVGTLPLVPGPLRRRPPFSLSTGDRLWGRSIPEWGGGTGFGSPTIHYVTLLVPPPLESAEEVEVYELYHVALADGLISLTEEVVVDGRYDLDLLDRAVVVGVIAIFQALPCCP